MLQEDTDCLDRDAGTSLNEAPEWQAIFPQFPDDLFFSRHPQQRPSFFWRHTTKHSSLWVLLPNSF